LAISRVGGSTHHEPPFINPTFTRRIIVTVLKSLTQHQINQGALRCPPNLPKIEFCLGPDCPGAYVLSTATNQTWFYRGKVQGKTTHFRIGSVSEIPLAEAKKQAMQMRAQLANSVNLKPENPQVKDDGISLRNYFQPLLSGQNPNKINCLATGGGSVL
jgi:hypothetical protein